MGRWAQAQRRTAKSLPTGGRVGAPLDGDFFWYQDAESAVAEMMHWPPPGADCILYRARRDYGPWTEVSGSGDIPDPCYMLNDLLDGEFVECQAAWGSGWPSWPVNQVSDWGPIAGFLAAV